MPRIHTYTRLRRATIESHVIVAREEDAWIGHVFEAGLWSFHGGREILAAALHHPCGYDRRRDFGEESLHDGPMSIRTWRSRNGGASWAPAGEVFNLPDARADLARRGRSLEEGPTDLARRGALISAATARVDGEERVLIHTSTNRGKTWRGPYDVFVPTQPRGRRLGQASSLKRADGETLLFVTVPSPPGKLRPVAAFARVIEHSIPVMAMLPASLDCDRVCPCAVVAGDGGIVAAVTERPVDSPGHTLVFRSEDHGRTWDFVTRANEIADPGHLAGMPDGRILLTYGWPLPPYRILARISDDGGATWGDEILVREGGGSPDLGSVRSVVREDGFVVSVYQWNTPREKGRFHGGRRYVAASVWRP